MSPALSSITETMGRSRET